jgi:DNA invertase Pin-like site-specific DNA recombinase
MIRLATKIKIEMLKKGISGSAIARGEGVHRTAIYHVIEGRSKSKKLRDAIEKALKQTFWPKNNDRRGVA